MKKTCRVLIGLTLLVALGGSAQATSTPLRRIASGASGAVGGGAAGGFAYLESATVLVVQTSTARRHYPVVSGCRPSVMTSVVIVIGCAGVPAPVILRLATGQLSALDVPPNAEIVPLAVGTQWVLADSSFSPDGVHREETAIAVNWMTGQIVDLGAADSLGRRAYPNLDAPALRAALCSPTIRLASGNGGGEFDLAPYARVAKAGPWILETTLRSYVVKRCGRRGDVLHLKISPAVTDATLGTGTLAYLDHTSVKLYNLTRGTSVTIAWPTTTPPTIALAGDRLLISAREPDGSYSIYKAS